MANHKLLNIRKRTTHRIRNAIASGYPCAALLNVIAVAKEADSMFFANIGDSLFLILPRLNFYAGCGSECEHLQDVSGLFQVVIKKR
jgi:hypothetical protein